MTDDLLVKLSKLLHTHEWPGDISLLMHASSLRCRVHALRGNEICTLYDGKAGNWAERETEDFRGETRRLVHFAEHKFPFRVPPWFCVGASDDYKGSLSSLSCRPFLNSVSDERSYFRLMICDPHDRDNEIDDPEELLSQLDHARWAPLRKEPWLGKVIHNDEIYELGAGAPGRETYHMDIAPDDGTIVDDYSYERGARVCRMRYPGDSDEEEEFFGDDDDD